MDVVYRSFRAMGCRATLHLVGADDALAEWAIARVDELEQRWSRFLPHSEISQLNRSGGLPTVVSADTMAVLVAAQRAWRATDGRFDPTVHDAMVGMGYDRPWADGPTSRPWEQHSAPGCAGIQLLESAGIVVLPPDVRIDLGGIGKGFAADLVAVELVERGAAGACVSLGGDLRCIGRGYAEDGRWEISIASPRPMPVARDRSAIERPRTVDLPAIGTTRLPFGGAVATSAPSATAFADGTHHLVDPATGACGRSPWSQVTVMARTAAAAEVWTKCAFLAGADAPDVLRSQGLAGVLVGTDGAIVSVGAPQHEMEAA